MIHTISTWLISGFLLLSAYSYFFSQGAIQGIRDLGFPDYFRIQLGVLKLIGALLLLIPSVPQYVKEWSYAGAALFLITAFVAHLAHGDSKWMLVVLVVLFGVLVTSRMTM